VEVGDFIRVTDPFREICGEIYLKYLNKAQPEAV
jgi:hypothetical protein